MERREFMHKGSGAAALGLAAAAGLVPAAARAQAAPAWNKGAFEAKNLAEAVKSLGGAGADHVQTAAMETALAVIRAHAAKVDGVKISLLDDQKEIVMRRRLPKGVRMYTGDDFNYAELIAGDAEGHSDALLGIFDPIAPAVGGALASLAKNDLTTFHEILAPTVPLSRHIFKAPTRFYKTGV
eukprot:gene7791-9635_t